jgi:hypothetical protein
MKVISGFLPETWGYFCMENFISTTRNCHSHIHESTHFILFAGPYKIQKTQYVFTVMKNQLI